MPTGVRIIEADDYVAQDLVITETEQEVDFGGEFTSIAFSVGKLTGGAFLEVKLNETTNDIITLDSQGSISLDFKVRRIFVRSTAGTQPATVVATRKT